MPDPEVRGPDSIVRKGRMQALMERIAADITEFGSGCDVYMKKASISKDFSMSTVDKYTELYVVQKNSSNQKFTRNASQILRLVSLNSGRICSSH